MDPKFVKGSPIPAHLGTVADQYREVRELRLAMQKETDAVKARETELCDHLINNLPKGSGAAKGQFYLAQITTSRELKVNDWPKLYAHIQATGRFDFLQKRLSEKAAGDWLEETGKPLPGTEIINVPGVSVTKV